MDRWNFLKKWKFFPIYWRGLLVYGRTSSRNFSRNNFNMDLYNFMSGELQDFLRFCLILTERINGSEHHDDRIFELLHSNLKYLISFRFNIVVERFKIFELHRVSSIKAFPKYLFLYWKSDLAHPIADWNFDNASLLFFHREKLINQLLQDLQQ